MRKYRLDLPVHYSACVTRLGLRKATNKDGTDYAEVVPTYVGPVDAETRASIKAYAESLAGVFASATVQHEDVLA